MNRSLLLSSALLVLCSATGVAQGPGPYGQGNPGTGGETPEIRSEQAWLGNGGFGIYVENGLGGADALVGLSLAPSNSTFKGAPLWIDRTQLLKFNRLTLSGPAGVPGAGSGFCPFPINQAPSPALAGRFLYAQAGVLDFASGSPAASRGLAIELVYPPQIFVGTSVGGGADPYWLVDAQTQTLEISGGNEFTDNCTSAVYMDGGLNLYVGSSIRSRVSIADLTTNPPTWASFTQFSAGGAYGLTADRNRKRLWVMTDPGVGSSELTAVDIDRNSGTYGQIIAQTSGVGASGIVERWGLSPDGKQAAVLQVFGNGVFLWDLDPNSGTYLQQTGTLFVPSSVSSPFKLNTQVRYSNDGSQLLVTIQHAGAIDGEVARYDFNTNTWIDHNAGLPGVDNIGPNSSPVISMGSAPAGMDMVPNGDSAIVCGIGGAGWAGRLDFDPANPATFSWTPASGASLPQAWGCGLNFTGSQCSVTSWDPPAVKVFDVASMSFQYSVALPGGSNIYTTVWR